MQAVAAYALPEDATVVSPPKTTDVSLISLTMPMAIGMVVFVAAIVGGFWGVVDRKTSDYTEQITKMASDVRDMKTRLELQSQVDEANERADSLVQDSMKQSVDELRRQVQLLQLQYQEISKQMRR